MKIVGICLIKNEDLYIKTVIRNVVHFCDELLVLDNYSNIIILKNKVIAIYVFFTLNTFEKLKLSLINYFYVRNYQYYIVKILSTCL